LVPSSSSSSSSSAPPPLFLVIIFCEDVNVCMVGKKKNSFHFEPTNSISQLIEWLKCHLLPIVTDDTRKNQKGKELFLKKYIFFQLKIHLHPC
jgi:hypothetical protein